MSMGFLGPINPVDESLEITVEGDLAVVKVEGEEVEAVRIEEGDDLVQVVEEIKTDYLEGKRGKRKLQEGIKVNSIKLLVKSIEDSIMIGDTEPFKTVLDSLNIEEGVCL